MSLRGGVSKDRMMSVHDPEMRHGHKSSRGRFDGHKAAIVVDSDTQLITAVEVLPGNAPDNLGALELVEEMLSLPKYNTGVQVQARHGRRRLWGRRDPSSLRRCGPQAGSPGARAPRPAALSQG